MASMDHNEFRAIHRFARIAPRKCRLIADLVRGRGINETLEILTYMHQRGARMIKRLIDSSVANASNGGFLDVGELYIQKIWVDEGPTLKRWRPRARGRAFPILKRTSHISVVVAPRDVVR